jgi:hypothetical protein
MENLPNSEFNEMDEKEVDGFLKNLQENDKLTNFIEALEMLVDDTVEDTVEIDLSEWCKYLETLKDEAITNEETLEVKNNQ